MTPLADAALPPLPPELMAALAEPAAPAPKRERTRRQLIDAALRVFSARGPAAATVQDIANAAGVAGATVYNHFDSKDALVRAVAVWLADGLCRRIADSYAAIPEGAERMAIGCRRYLWLAEQAPAWALLLMDLGAQSQSLQQTTAGYVLADLRLGVKQKSFRVTTEAAALDLVGGTISQAMRMIAVGLAPAGHAQAVAALVLTGLGLPLEAARAVARRPLPPLRSAAALPAPISRRRGLAALPAPVR